jgi:hypothetical protein
MPDISKLEGSPWEGTDTRWSKASTLQSGEYFHLHRITVTDFIDSRTRRPTRPTENALCSHVWNRTRTLTPSQTLRIRDAIPHGDTARTDDLDVSGWNQFAASIQACRPSIIPIAKELGIMMASFPNCPEDQCRIHPLTTAAQVMSRNNLQNHFGTRAISTPPSLYSQLILAEDMSIVEGQGDATLQSYNQHLWGLRREYGRSRDSTIDWNRPGETVNGARLTLGAVYEGLSKLVHQSVYVDPVSRVGLTVPMLIM